MELLRSGKILLNNLDKEALEIIKKSAIYKYSNMYRQEGLSQKLKPKLEHRIRLCEEFEDLTTSTKFEICKAIWEQSMGIRTINTGIFEEFDFGDIIEMYKQVGMIH